MDEFFLKLEHKKYLVEWIPILSRSLLKKVKVHPRCISLLKFMTSLNNLIEKTGTQLLRLSDYFSDYK